MVNAQEFVQLLLLCFSIVAEAFAVLLFSSFIFGLDCSEEVVCLQTENDLSGSVGVFYPDGCEYCSVSGLI